MSSSPRPDPGHGRQCGPRRLEAMTATRTPSAVSAPDDVPRVAILGA
ncbi:hypothetical protein GUG48_11825, partial [Xanthomonas citri pv. citri]|nr:hypothetical protein [Xanthomonas citri pv. citri]